jgi:hypothetical protein
MALLRAAIASRPMRCDILPKPLTNPWYGFTAILQTRQNGSMTQPLEQEIATFERERSHLEREHFGKFVLVHGDSVIDSYDDFERAAEEGVRRFGDEPFLIRRVGKGRAALSPAIQYGLTGAPPAD